MVNVIFIWPFLNFVFVVEFQIDFSSISFFSFQLQEEFEDTKRVIGIRKSKDRQHNDQTKKEQRTRIDLQNNTQKTKDGIS